MVILRYRSVLLWALLALGHAAVSARPLTGQHIAEDLRSQLSTASEIISPSEASYATDFTPRYNIAASPTYIVAVKPALVTDVQITVRLCTCQFVRLISGFGNSQETIGQICAVQQCFPSQHRRRPWLFGIPGSNAGGNQSRPRQFQDH